MSLKTFAILFGIAFLLAGLLGFVPALTPDGKLLGLFMVDTFHNFVHILSGIVALLAANSEKYSKLYFQIFGIVYGLVTVLGFFTHDLHFMMVNQADNFLHLGISLAALYLGFIYPRQGTDTLKVSRKRNT